MSRQTSTRPQKAAPAKAAGSEALAEQTAESVDREAVESAEMRADRRSDGENRHLPKGYAERVAKLDRRGERGPDEERHDRFKARRDASDTARKRHAEKTGGNLFPEVKPMDQQIVLATKVSRVGSPQFMAQYRTQSPAGKDGAFYSNLNGTYSMLEGAVDSWMELPG